MIALDNGDKIRGYASAAAVVDYTLHGFVGTAVTQLADGQLALLEGDLYTAGAAIGVATVVLVNTDSVARTVNLYSLSVGGTKRNLLPVAVSLEAGYALYFDGVSAVVVSTSGGIVSSGQVSDVAYNEGTWNGVSTIAPSKNAVRDVMELKANLVSPAFTTPDLGTPSACVLTNCTGLPLTGLVATAWTTPAFDAGNFTASGSMTWTVEAGDVTTFAYQIIGKVMTIQFILVTTTVGGTLSGNLQILLPASKVAAKTQSGVLYSNQAATWVMSAMDIVGGATILRCFVDFSFGGANWAASTNATYLRGWITLEIQ